MEENKIIIQRELSIEDIKNLIYTIRGKQVMLDSDVAMLYHYQTKRINEAVKRNKERFPENFCFQLTTEEIENIKMPNEVLNFKSENNWSQFATSSKSENIKQKIFFEGQIYDAYSLIIDIIKKANKKILIIDNYIDDSVLKMLTKKNNNVEVVILT